MPTMIGIILVVCVACLTHTAAAERCFECSDMPHPEDCEIITMCSQYEHCHVEQYVTSGGIVLYNSGCIAKEKCAAGTKRASFINVMEKRRPLAKRQDPVSNTDIATCIQCCDGEFCNYEGCGTVAQPKSSRGTKCFTCTAQANPESCRRIQTCDRSQVCAILKSTHNLLEEAWETSCMREIQCNAMVLVQSHNYGGLVGRRASTVVNHCPRCCTSDFCNHSCRHLISYNTTTSMPVPTTPPSTTLEYHSATSPTIKHTHPPTHKPTTTHRPTTHRPATHKPTTHKPATHKPTTTTHKPATTTHKPTTHKPATHKPTTPKPTTTTERTTIKTTTTTPKPTTDPAVGCKIDGYTYNAHFRLCLKFFENERLNWTEAQTYCNRSKGQLAIITGQQKIDDVLSLYKTGGYSSPLWVGATDLGNGHVFTFTDGSKLTVDPSQGHDLTDANCLYVNNGSYNGFGPCKEKHGFICERSSTIREK